MVEFTRANGLIISSMGKGTKSLPTAQSTKETTSKASLKAVADTSGKMESSMKANGLMDLSTAQVSGEEPKVIPILGSGAKAKLTDMVCIHGRMEIGTKANSRNA